MVTRAFAAALLVLLSHVDAIAAEGSAKPDSRRASVRVIGQTTVVGESDSAVWKSVLDILPVPPGRIEVLDLNSLSDATRQKLRGLEAFVLTGQTTIVVIRQGATLRCAETGDALDRLALASLVWHEMGHANGLDERAALGQEEALWRRFVATGLVEGAVGMSYIARLREASAEIPTGSRVAITHE